MARRIPLESTRHPGEGCKQLLQADNPVGDFTGEQIKQRDRDCRHRDVGAGVMRRVRSGQDMLERIGSKAVMGWCQSFDVFRRILLVGFEYSPVSPPIPPGSERIMRNSRSGWQISAYHELLQVAEFPPGWTETLPAGNYAKLHREMFAEFLPTELARQGIADQD